jgi:hypothetical protein
MVGNITRIQSLLISSWIKFWFFTVIPKYLNCATFSKHLLVIFLSWFCPAFWWRDSSIYVVFSALTSRPASLIASIRVSVFLNYVGVPKYVIMWIWAGGLNYHMLLLCPQTSLCLRGRSWKDGTVRDKTSIRSLRPRITLTLVLYSVGFIIQPYCQIRPWIVVNYFTPKHSPNMHDLPYHHACVV